MGCGTYSSHDATRYILYTCIFRVLHLWGYIEGASTHLDASITRSWTLIPGASHWDDSVRRRIGGRDAESSSAVTVDREAAAEDKRQRHILPPPPRPGEPSSTAAPSRPILPICELPQFLRDCAMEESDSLAGQAGAAAVEGEALTRSEGAIAEKAEKTAVGTAGMTATSGGYSPPEAAARDGTISPPAPAALAEGCFEFDFCGVVLGSSAVHTPDGKLHRILLSHVISLISLNSHLTLRDCPALTSILYTHFLIHIPQTISSHSYQ